MSITRRSTLAAAGALLAATPAAGASSVQIPFRITRNRPWTAASINGKEPVAFLIDTGSNVFGISNKAAKAHGLTRYARGQVQGAVGRANVPFYFAKEVAIGGGAVREKDPVLAGVMSDDADLIVGSLPAARWAIMGLDFDTQQMTIALRMADNGPPEGHEELATYAQGESFGTMNRMGTSAVDPEHFQDLDHRPVIDAAFDGQPVRLLVDTGATGMLFLFPDYVKKRGLWDHYPKHLESGIGTIAGDAVARTVRAQKLRIGRYGFANPIVHLGDPADSGRDSVQDAQGVIGMEVLRRINFLHHPIRRRFYFRPSKAIQDVYRYNRAGMDVDLVDGEIRVTWVTPDGPAAKAGLVRRDKVTGWRGADGYYGLIWALQGAAGSRVDIQVERSGAPAVVTVVLEDLV
ncbi:MAG TPA: aspartyl protease family protein [Caulobacter sp.]|nr:aspartyl protease family protein [Caulobacter sp.]